MHVRSKYIMYYGATSETQEKAKLLRGAETNAEKILWQELKSRKLNGLKFRRQHPISQFIADFYCHELKLVIEVDGEIHNRPENKEYDENRTAEIETFEIKVIRFRNCEIENDIKKVMETLKREIKYL